MTTPNTEGEQQSDPKTSDSPEPVENDGQQGQDGKPDEPLGEPGKRALERERADRKSAEDRAKTAEAELAKYRDAEKTEVERAQGSAKDAADKLTSTERELWLYKALTDHPVPQEHRHLVRGDTEEEVKAAAESISQLSSRPGVVHESGTEGDGKPAGTSVNTGRDLFRSRHNRDRKE